MFVARLRKVGGSVMLALPPAILELTDLHANESVGITLDQGNLIIRPAKPRYKIQELLDQCDFAAPAAEEDAAWHNATPAGRELL